MSGTDACGWEIAGWIFFILKSPVNYSRAML